MKNRITFSLDDDLLRAFRRYTEENYLNTSALLEGLVHDYLSKMGIEIILEDEEEEGEENE